MGKQPISKRRRKFLFWGILIVLLLAGAGGYSWWEIRRSKDEVKKSEERGQQKDRTFLVERGKLVLGITQPGSISASKKHQITAEANTRSTIIWVIPENSKVKAGDKLVEFDATELQNKIADGKIELENIQKEQELALESQRLEESTQAAERAAAEERVTKAADALRKYQRYERRQNRDSYDLKISSAEDAISAAHAAYRELKNNPETDTDESKQAAYKKKLSDAKGTIASAENGLQSAEDSRRVWKRYDEPSRIKALLNEVDQADLNLEKVRVALESSRNRTERQLNNYRLRIRRMEEDMEQNEKFRTMMTLTAPVDGIVIYGNPDRPWGNEDIKPGLEVWRGMVLMTIPSMSDLVVDVDFPEQYRSRVKEGDRVIVTPDSLPNLKLSGAVDNIPALPVNVIFWDSSSPKVYKSKIRFDAQSEALVNGMSVQVEVITRTLENVIYLPVESVFEDKERFYVYRRTPGGGHEERDIQIGESNDRFVEITEGLEEGDMVYLYRPYQTRQGQ